MRLNKYFYTEIMMSIQNSVKTYYLEDRTISDSQVDMERWEEKANHNIGNQYQRHLTAVEEHLQIR